MNIVLSGTVHGQRKSKDRGVLFRWVLRLHRGDDHEWFIWHRIFLFLGTDRQLIRGLK
jgi:hypothetical protein